ncbi:MAG: transposase [Legionellaceae bacterium]|nr:transposase [Legionellaceae bacterium]
MTTKLANRNYTKELKEEAVSLVLDQGYTVTEVANSLGVTTKVIYNWKQKIEAQKSDGLLSDDERTVLIKLRKENKRLLMEREILKKASVDSTGHCNTSFNLSAGDKKFNVFLSLSFNSLAI